jgi:hypothetical protein
MSYGTGANDTPLGTPTRASSPVVPVEPVSEVGVVCSIVGNKL